MHIFLKAPIDLVNLVQRLYVPHAAMLRALTNSSKNWAKRVCSSEITELKEPGTRNRIPGSGPLPPPFKKESQRIGPL